MNWTYDARLPHASTIPSRFSTDPGTLDDENRNVFGRTLQLAGHAGQVRENGAYFTAVIGGEPVLVVRGGDGRLRAMSNVCRHRAGPVAKGAGRKPVLQCGYHGWTYTLEGQLHATPEMEGIECFDRGDFRLPQFGIDEWQGLLFVNLDPAEPFEIRRGDRIAQLVVQAVAEVRWSTVEALPSSERGSGGFGHTGR